MIEKDKTWKAALGELELIVGKNHFATWFTNTYISRYEDGVFTVSVPTNFAKEWFCEKYHKIIFRTLQSITGEVIKNVVYEIGGTRPPEDTNDNIKKESIEKLKSLNTATEQIGAEASPDLRSDQQKSAGLNNRYDFDSFVVGSSNELAKAACFAVSENPGNVYNPLFIYGGVGLGKTHLTQAIGNKIIDSGVKKRIKYIPTKNFTDDLITALQSQKMTEFQDRYRDIDVLIMDDIQFLIGKEKTQEQFFHIFNNLYESNHQIILSSDRPPKALPALEDRLRSRFEGGMIADVGLPDLETRIAILRKKANEKSFPVDDDAIRYIASTFQKNVREIEGALNRLVVNCQLKNASPSLDFAKEVLKDLVTTPKQGAVTIKNIIEAVKDFYNLNEELLISSSRKKEVVQPRQIAMFLAREETKSSYPTIGQEMGGRDHTTAIHAYSKIKAEVERDESLKQEIGLIRQRIYSAQP